LVEGKEQNTTRNEFDGAKKMVEISEVVEKIFGR
jgi:hypothetical protein